MASRTPSGVELCAAEEFDYYDITSAVVQRLEDQGQDTCPMLPSVFARC